MIYTHKFSDLVDIVDGDRGTNYPKQHDFFSKGYCLFLSTKNVPNYKFCFDDSVFISKEKDECLRKGKLRRGDYVLTTRGTVGNFARYYIDIPYENIRINSGMVVLRPKTDLLNNDYLQFILQSDLFEQKVKSICTGSAQPQLPIRDLLSIEFPIPELKTQERIASLLKTYNELVSNNEKRIKILEEIAQRLYTEWFVKFKFPGYEKVKMSDSGTEYGLIPEGWSVKELGELAYDKRNQVSPSKVDQNTPYVGLEHIPRKTIVLIDWGKANDVSSSKLEFNKGDVLFGKIRPYFHKVVSAPIKGITSSDTIVIAAKEEKWRMLVLMCTSSDNFVSYSTSTSQGTKMPRADWKTLKKYKVVIPNESVLNHFNSSVHTYLSDMNNLMFQNRSLSTMRDLLIPQLVTGKREVK